MGRSFWKGRNFSNSFVEPLYTRARVYSCAPALYPVLPRVSKEVHETTVRLYRRNHQLAVKQFLELNTVGTYEIYNGYDFFKQPRFNNISSESNLKTNVAQLVCTREMNVVHKAKVSKDAKKVIKRGYKKSKTMGKAQNRKQPLTKKFKK